MVVSSFYVFVFNFLHYYSVLFLCHCLLQSIKHYPKFNDGLTSVHTLTSFVGEDNIRKKCD